MAWGPCQSAPSGKWSLVSCFCLWHYASLAITTTGNSDLAWSDPASCTRYKFGGYLSLLLDILLIFSFLWEAAKPRLVSPLLKFTLCLLPTAEGAWKVHKGNKILQWPLKLNKILVYGLGLFLPTFPMERGREAVDFNKANILGLEKVKWPQMPDKVFAFFQYDIWILKYGI